MARVRPTPSHLWRASITNGFGALLCCLLIGCRSGGGPTRHDARSAYYQGHFQACVDDLRTITERTDDPDVRLDLAMAHWAAGDVSTAASQLRTLRSELDHDASTAVGSTASMVADDTVRPFRLSPEERILLPTLLSLCELCGDEVDAESYSLQAMMRRRELLNAANLSPSRDIALTPYIRGMIREASHRDYDDATKAYQTVAATMPTFAPIGDDILRAGGGVHSRPGHGVLYVFAMTGAGPYLVETEAPTTSAAMAIASAAWSAKVHADQDDDASALPNIASVKVPAVEVPSSPTQSVWIAVNDQSLGTTQTITNVMEMARQRLDDEMPAIMARAIVRRATKEVAVATSTRAMGMEGDMAALFHFAAASTWSAVESADTRCWSLLPREIQVMRVELPVGHHQWSWAPADIHGAPLVAPTMGELEIVDGRNAYRVVVAP